MLKILMLVNWKVEYADRVPEGVQPPDYYVKGEPYWFFRYFKEDVQVDVIDTHSFSWLENFEKNKLHFYIWQSVKVIPKLNKYDLILSHGAQSGIVLSLFRRLYPGKAKHILFDIGAFNSAAEGGAALKLMQWTSKSIDGVIYHTSSQVEYYKDKFPWLVEKSRFILYGADRKYFGRDNSMEPKNTILCIGSQKRDWDTVVKAYIRLVERITEENNKVDGCQDLNLTNKQGIQIPELHLIGKESYSLEKQFSTMCDLKIHTTKFLPLEELVQEIQASKFGVLPLKAFNYSFGQMTLLQQMALGKAVITAKVPSMVDYVTDGVTGLLYESENDEELAEKMYLLYRDTELKERIEKRAQHYIKEEYNEKHMAENIESYLREMVKED